MTSSNEGRDRRQFLTGTLAAVSGAAVSQLPMSCAMQASAGKEPVKNEVCTFTKFLQPLSYQQTAEVIAEMGLDGIEGTVRAKGHVLPERAEEDLPKFVEALKSCGLDMTVMTSDINSLEHPHAEKVLRTAAALGIKQYRMAYYKYDLTKPVAAQLDSFRSPLKDLVQFSKELGIQPVYQNHSGSRYVGAPIWDLYSLIKDYPVSDIGVAFDIRHASIEGGLSWPIQFNLITPHLAVVYVKDFKWEGPKAAHAPLGQGYVDPKFFDLVRAAGFTGPVSLHVEYLTKEGVQPNIDAIRRDLKVLRRWLKA